mgnify:CR=1 FL=1
MRLKGIVSRFLFGSVCLSCGCGEKPLDPWLCENCRELLLKERHGSAVSENAFSLYNMGPVSRALIHGLKTVDVFVKGPGSGREAAIRALQACGLEVTSICDVTPVPHNGCRPPKRRRV